MLKSDAVSKALKRKGFVVEKGRSKHMVYSFVCEGKITEITTHMSHNKQEIGSTLQKKMAEQIYLSRPEFLDMVSCKIGYEELLELYRRQNLTPK